jgi:hypothetical protein
MVDASGLMGLIGVNGMVGVYGMMRAVGASGMVDGGGNGAEYLPFSLWLHLFIYRRTNTAKLAKMKP